MIENINAILEYTFDDIKNRNRNVKRLFPAFDARIAAVAGNGGVRLVNYKKPDLWTFKIASGTKDGVEYTNYVHWLDIIGQIRRAIANDTKKLLWTKDGKNINVVKLAIELFRNMDIEIVCQCLVGSTKIPLLDGQVLTMEQLDQKYSGKDFWVYASDENGDMIPAKARCLMTGMTDKTIKAHLDNGEVVECTSDHLFRLRDGSYKEAQHLQPNESLMPFYTKEQKPNGRYSQKYLKVKVNSKLDGMQRPIWKMVHRVVAEKLLQKEFFIKKEQVNERFYVVHHKDMNSFNNTPENLEWLGKKEHWLKHATCDKTNCINAIKKAWADPKWRAEQIKLKVKAGRACFDKHSDMLNDGRKLGIDFMRTPEGRKKASDKMKDTWKKKREVMLNALSTRVFTDETKIKMRKAAAIRWNRQDQIEKARCHTIERNKTAPRDLQTGKFLPFHNHKVICIEIVQHINPIPVYDLVVDTYHNFAIAAGVFVHNCPAFQFWGPAYTLTQAHAKYTHPENRPPNIRNPHQYGCQCKHSSLLWQVLPTYTSTMAKWLNIYYLGIIGGAEHKVLKQEKAKAASPKDDDEEIDIEDTGKKESVIRESVEDNLYAEAKKYDSIEDFIKSQELYHGTSADFEKFAHPKDVPEEFMNVDPNAHTFGTYFTDNKELAGEFGKNIKTGFINKQKFFDLTDIKSFDDLVSKLPIDKEKEAWELKNMVSNSYYDRYKPTDSFYRPLEQLMHKYDLVPKLREKGYEGIIFNDKENGISGKTFVVFNPENIKTKSQLTDIWNKAHGVKESQNESFEKSTDQLFVWRRNKQGGQKIGNRQIVREVNMDDFKKEVLPRTQDDWYAGNTPEEKYHDFLKKEPGTVISYVDTGSGFQVSKIANIKDIMQNIDAAIKRGWAMPVRSFAEGLAFRRVADSENESITDHVQRIGAFLNV